MSEEKKIINLANYQKKPEIGTVKSLGFDDITQDSQENGEWDTEVKAFIESHTLKGLFFSEDWVFITLDLIANEQRL